MIRHRVTPPECVRTRVSHVPCGCRAQGAQRPVSPRQGGGVAWAMRAQLGDGSYPCDGGLAAAPRARRLERGCHPQQCSVPCSGYFPAPSKASWESHETEPSAPGRRLWGFPAQPCPGTPILQFLETKLQACGGAGSTLVG